MNLKQKLPRLFSELENTLVGNPVEILLCLSSFFISRQENLFGMDYEPGYMPAWLPVLFTVSFCLNNLFRQNLRRIIYYLSFFLIIPVVGALTTDFTESVPFAVLFFTALILLFIYRFYKDNVLFAKSALRTALNTGYALMLSGLLFLTAVCIYGSVNIIFLSRDFFGDSGSGVFLILQIVFILVFPVVFLVFDRIYGPPESFKVPSFPGILIKYVLTPAILIYTVILYIYFATIALKWELPDGGLSVMVFVYLIVSFLTKAVNETLPSPFLERFYKNFGFIALLPALMMWTAALYRINEYGLTQARIYLLLSDTVLTAALLCLMFRKTAHYLYIAVGAVLLFSFFTYIPPVSAETAGLRCQVNRIYRYGEELGLLDANRKFTPGQKASASDSLYRDKYEKILGGLEYYEDYLRQKDNKADRKSIMHEKFGTDSREFESRIASRILPKHKPGSLVSISPDRSLPIDVSGFAALYPLGYPGDSSATVSVQTETSVQTSEKYAVIYRLRDGGELLKLSYREILEKQSRKIGSVPDSALHALETSPESVQKFCRLDTLDYALIMSFLLFTPDGTQLEDITFDKLLLRKPL